MIYLQNYKIKCRYPNLDRDFSLIVAKLLISYSKIVDIAKKY